jgi:anthranilate synthase component 1
VGYFSFYGNLESLYPYPGPLPSDGRGRNIRPVLVKDGKAYVQAGGGWVNDSEPEAEFQETVNESKAVLKAVALTGTCAKSSWCLTLHCCASSH